MDLLYILGVDLRGGIRSPLSLLLRSTTTDGISTGFGEKIVENHVEDVEAFPPLCQKFDGVKGNAFACENRA